MYKLFTYFFNCLLNNSLIDALTVAICPCIALFTYLLFYSRNYRPGDSQEVAKLCCDIFDGPFQPYDIISKNVMINNHKKQLESRYNEKVNGAISHSMIVGTSDNEVISFLEVGLLPSPIPVKVTWNGVETDTTIDVLAFYIFSVIRFIIPAH